jgi:hypothetical protein
MLLGSGGAARRTGWSPVNRLGWHVASRVFMMIDGGCKLASRDSPFADA